MQYFYFLMLVSKILYINTITSRLYIQNIDLVIFQRLRPSLPIMNLWLFLTSVPLHFTCTVLKRHWRCLF